MDSTEKPVVDSPPPIIVDFPLRGEWTAYHTPAARVPSHGTDQLAQRYAYDFLRIERDSKGWKFCRPSVARAYLTGVPLSDCYGWGEPIYAPFDGTVVEAEDAWPERNPVYFLGDLAVLLRNAFTFDMKQRDALRAVIGNHVILKMHQREVYALVAHARSGSVRVRAGDRVRAGVPLAAVGHSGNSTAPHLHFHLMDAPSALEARGLPCAFRRYQALRDGTWTSVIDSMPARREFIRSAPGL